MREHRLTRRPEFVAVYSAGRRFFSKNFIVFILRPGAEAQWRLGLAVTRKTGTAVVRNRIKRVLREFFRLNGNVLAHGMDVVITLRRGLDPALVTLGMAEQELAPVLRQAAGRLARESPQV